MSHEAMKFTERLERNIILRSSRFLLLCLGAASVLLGTAATAYLGYGFVPAARGEDPTPPPKPKIVILTMEELHRLLPKPAVSAEGQSKKISKNVRSPSPPSPPSTAKGDALVAALGSADPLEPLLEQIHQHFPGDGSPWQDVSTSYCTKKGWWNGPCRRWATKTTPGFRTRLLSQISAADEGTSAHYFEAVLAFLPTLAAEKSVKTFGKYLELQGTPAALTTLAQELSTLMGTIPASWQLYFMNGLERTLENQRITGSAVSALARGAEVTATVPDDQRTDALLLTARFIREGIDGHPLPDAVVANMKVVVAQMVPTDRLQTVIAFRRAFHKRMMAQTRAYKEALSQVAQQSASLDRSYALAQEKKAEVRQQGLMGLGAGVAALAVVGWFLALLAIERNTRAVHALTRAPGLQSIGQDETRRPSDGGPSTRAVVSSQGTPTLGASTSGA